MRDAESWWDRPGGGREVLRVAWPLILSTSFWSLQIAVDRLFLKRIPGAVSANLTAALLYLTPAILVQLTAGYASTFVAQYVGAGRTHRVGPVVWQAIYVAVVGGIAFLGLLPLAGPLMDLVGHAPEVRQQEVVYFQCLCFAALPFSVQAAACSFFTGRGESRVVLLVDAVGLSINALLAPLWIHGEMGFPALGIEGAGWATVVGTSCSATLAVTLFLRRGQDYGSRTGWRFDRALCRRLLRYGVPNGLLFALDGLAFSMFLIFIGRIGTAEQTATAVACTLNMFAFMPPYGLSQAVQVLVGQHLGEDRPDRAERAVWTGAMLSVGVAAVWVVLYLVMPQTLVEAFGDLDDPVIGAQVAAIAPVLLRFVAFYVIFDCINLTLSSALRGAGDTRFVSATALVLGWSLMVVPTILAQRNGWGLYVAWGSAATYVIVVSLVFLVRFRAGGWKSMRVIEQGAEIAVEEAAPARVAPDEVGV